MSKTEKLVAQMVGAQQIGAKNSEKLVAQMVGASQRRPPVLYLCVRVVQYLPTVRYLSRYLSNCATVVFQKSFLIARGLILVLVCA